MKKKLLIGTVLPALAAAAVVGSGFALWVFNDLHVETTQSSDLSKEVTQMVKVGTITKAKDFKIVFDQTEDGRNKNNTLAGHIIGANKVAAKGIYLDFGEGATAEDKVAKYTAPAEDYAIDETAGIKFNFTTTIELSETLATFVEIKYDTTAFIESAGKYTHILADNVREFNWASVTLNYKENKEPSNETEYVEFRNAVNSDVNVIKVTYQVDITATNN